MTKNQNDQNLLFGVLALQVDLVTQGQLTAGMQKWITAKHRTLGDILVEQAAIDEQQRAALDALVAAHIAAHGGSEQSLLSAVGTKDVATSLRRIGDAEVLASLSFGDGNASSTDLPTLAIDDRKQPKSRYRILRLHEEGGLGRVYEALDEELDRTVALKEIKEKYATDKNSQSRFMLEAEVTGGLEHPGIVPVYGLGRYDDGRPYYAMRFIRGGSLRAAIREFHETDWRTMPSGARAIQLGRLLRRFIDVCNAMAYSHRRGVLHRDLKPGNIMLGQFGETLVVDWGLAKTLGDKRTTTEEHVLGTLNSDAHDSANLDSVGSDPSLVRSNSGASNSDGALLPRAGSTVDETKLGEAIGSPPYMSPEQARGDHDKLGPATDIYSLGGILYTLLTNKLPIEGDSFNEILTRVREGKIRKPRTVASNVPPPLESIAMKAMSMSPSSRYGSAEELIQDIENYLADEHVLAHHESLGQRLSRMSRRHRNLVHSVTAALLAITAVSTIAALSLNRQQQMTAREKLRGDHVLEHIVNVFRRPDPELDGRDITVAQLLDRAVVETNAKFADDPLAKASILQAIGETYAGLGLGEECLSTLVNALEIRRQHLGAAHIETLRTEFTMASAQISLYKTTEAISAFKDIVERQKALLGANHEHTISSLNGLAYAYVMSGDTDSAIATYEQSLVQQRTHTVPDYEATAATLSGIAHAYNAAGQNEKASKKIDEAVRYSTEHLGDSHPTTLGAMHLQAMLLHKLNRTDESLPVYEATLAKRREQLGDSHGDTISTMNDLAMMYFVSGRTKDAVKLFQDTYGLRKEKFGDQHLLTRTSLHNLASVYQKMDRADLAATVYQRLVDSFSETERLQTQVIPIYGALVAAYESSDKIENAKPAYEQLVKITAHDTRKLSRSLRGLSHASIAGAQYADAKHASEQWISTTGGSDRAEALLCLAESELGLANLSAASSALDQAADELKEQTTSADAAYLRHLRGAVLAEQGKYAEAEPMFLESYDALITAPTAESPKPRLSYRKRIVKARITAFYQKWGEPEKDSAWKNKLRASN